MKFVCVCVRACVCVCVCVRVRVCARAPRKCACTGDCVALVRREQFVDSCSTLVWRIRGAVPSDAASRGPRRPPCPDEPPLARVACPPLAAIPVSSCSYNYLRAGGATALSSGLAALTNLRSIDIW